MKRILQFMLALCVLITPTAQGQVVIFSEDFDGVDGPTAGGPGTYTFPAGWLLRNVDNRTPDGQVAYVNEAWERREDFNFNVADSAAFSTSWYSPVGAADDWMWTPLISTLPANCRLKWNAVAYDPAYPDGYEVRIMTSTQGPPTGGSGTLGNQVTNSTVLFSTGAENTAWTARTVSLSAYAGQSVYIGFRNNSNNQFLLLIDDVVVEQVLNNEVSINAVQQYEYTLTPVSQVPAAGMALGATIKNNGINAANNLVLTARVFDSNNNQVYTSSSTPTTLASGATTTLTTAGFVPAFADNFTVEYEATISVADDLPANNIATTTLAITNNIYARDNGNVIGALGIGAGNGGYLGQDFAIENTTSIGAVQVYYTQGYTGEKMAVVVWDMSGGFPNAIVASTDTLVYPDDSARLYTLPIHGGGFTLNPGRYAITAVEFDSTVQVGLTQDIFTPGRTWVDWPTNPVTDPWGNNEDYGPGFERAYVIRPVLCPGFSANPTSADAVCTSNGTATVAPTGGEEPYTYNWSNGGTAANISAPAGTYSVTITDNLGCQENTSVTINSNTLTIASTTGVNDANCTTADGGASVTPSNGTSPYTYQWSNGGVNNAINNLTPGNYSVTITDSKGCTGTNTAVVGTNTTILTSTVSTTAATCAAADGSAGVTVTNGTAPYNYLWSNGGVNAAINNVAAANYTVTITDSKGCVGENTATVAVGGTTLNTTTSATSASCAVTDGTATVSVNNGLAPYSYAWSNSGNTATITGLTTGNYAVTVTDANGCTGSNSVSVTSSAIVIAATVSSTDATCTAANGSLTAVPTNGTAPYTYSWSGSQTGSTANNLAAGNYTVTITDAAGCTGSVNATVTATSLTLSTTTNATAATCTASNGSVSVAVNNGTSPYTYAWSNGGNTDVVNNQSAGSYTVTVTDANGCSGTASVDVLTDNVTLSLTTSTTETGCTTSTGTATVDNVADGTSPYTYLWSNTSTDVTATALAAGGYQVTVTDANGCSATAGVTVGTAASPTATATATDVDCSGGTTGGADVTLSGAASPVTYLWSNGATTQSIANLAAGSYNVTATDNNGCTVTASATVNEPTALAITASVSNATSGNNGAVNINVTGGSPAYSFNWSNSAVTEDISGLGAGTYTVTVTDNNGCTATATYTLVSVGLANTDAASVVKLFPNPATDVVQLQISLAQSDDLTVQLADVTGKLVMSQYLGEVKDKAFTLNLGTIASGVYHIRISGNNVNTVQRLVIEK